MQVTFNFSLNCFRMLNLDWNFDWKQPTYPGSNSDCLLTALYLVAIVTAWAAKEYDQPAISVRTYTIVP